MKRFQVVVPWPAGLHLRPAALLVRVAQRFRSRMSLECGGQVADLRSVLGIVALCASMGSSVEVLACGEDEQDAAAAVEQIFASAEGDAVREVQVHKV